MATLIENDGPIPGRIQLETAEPVVLRQDDGRSSLRWMVPLALMGLIAIYLLLRRRQDS